MYKLCSVTQTSWASWHIPLPSACLQASSSSSKKLPGRLAAARGQEDCPALPLYASFSDTLSVLQAAPSAFMTFSTLRPQSADALEPASNSPHFLMVPAYCCMHQAACLSAVPESRAFEVTSFAKMTQAGTLFDDSHPWCPCQPSCAS